MSEEIKEDVQQESEAIPFSEFLESIPPSTFTKIEKLTSVERSGQYIKYHKLIKPEIQLHCPEDSCNGIRFFRCTDSHDIKVPNKSFDYIYISYICSNCRKTKKTFSLAVQRDTQKSSGECYKFGELPLYGPPTPARLMKLIGPDREIFLKGRRCENQGLGIGAFVYYRRVVENQKSRILDEIIKVSSKLNADEAIIQKLRDAKKETQFSKSLASVKKAVPQTLLINGHNPLTLLHSALSDGLHDQTDEHCLEIASSVRVVLGELSDRLAQALKDEAELNTALSKLMNIKNKG